MGVIALKTACVNELECDFRVDFNLKSTPSSTLPCQCHGDCASGAILNQNEIQGITE